MPGSYQLSGLRCRSYVDGYGLLQSFTTGGTAQGLQTTPITPAALFALTGVMDLDGADGASFIFARSSGATTLTAWVTGFEPIVSPTGTVVAYIERPISSTAAVALTTGVLVTTVTLDATSTTGNIAQAWCGAAPTTTAVPVNGLFVSSSAGLTGQMVNFSKEDAGTTSGIMRWNFAGGGLGGSGASQQSAYGVTHVRVLLSCATATEKIFCLAKRLRGAANLY